MSKIVKIKELIYIVRVCKDKVTIIKEVTVSRS